MFLSLNKHINLNNNKLLKDVILLILVALVITVIWFRRGILYGGGEDGLPFADLNLSLKQTFSVWLDSYLGAPSLSRANYIPFYFFANLFFSLGIPGWVVQASVHFLLISVGMISMYFLVKTTIKRDFKYEHLALFAGLFYFLNPYSMSQVWGRGIYLQFIPFASLPLMLLLLNLALEKLKIIYILLLIIVSFIFSGGFTPSYVLTFWIMIAIVFGYNLLIKRKNFYNIIKVISFFIILLISWLLIHSWWIVNYFTSGATLYLDNKYQTDIGLITLIALSNDSTFASIIRLLQNAIFNTNWLYGDFYSSFIFKVVSWVIPILFIFTIPQIKKSKYLIFWTVLFVPSLLICLGANFPLGFLFVWIFNHLPVLQVFRDPYEKFGIVLLISYTPLITLGYFRLSESLKLRFKGLHFTLKTIILFIIFFLLVWPMWNGSVITTQKDLNFVSVPQYYRDFKNWLTQNNKGNNRIFMLPFLPGSGTKLSWGGRTYVGVDPSINFLDYSVISSVQDFPYTLPFLNELYKDISKIPTSSILGLLRTKYLVIRDDVIQEDKRDLKQENNLLQGVKSPNSSNDKMTPICTNATLARQTSDSVVFLCQMPINLADWSRYRYLHLLLKTDKPAILEIDLRDQNQHRPRWYFTANNTSYQTLNSEWTKLNLDLELPTDKDENFNFTQVSLLEIWARPNPATDKSRPIEKIDLQAAFLDEGYEIKLDDYQFINQFGKLRLYQLKKYKDFSEVSIPTDIKQVNELSDLFPAVANLTTIDGKTALVVGAQNINFSLFPFVDSSVKITINRYTPNKYLVDFEKLGSQYIVLNKTFNSWWKVIPGVSGQDLDGNIFSDINLLQRKSLGEEKHFVVNGYANLWKVDGSQRSYAIVYLPQILTDVLLKISLAVMSVIVIITIIWFIKRYYSKSGKISA